MVEAFFVTGGDESGALMFFPHPGLQLFLEPHGKPGAHAGYVSSVTRRFLSKRTRCL